MTTADKKVSVLLVDDFALLRQGVATALESSGTIAVAGEAGTVDEAVALAEQLQPDVVVLDMRLPGGGGLVAIDRLGEVAPDARILILTASDKPETLIEAVSAGAAGYLTKSVRGEDLCAAVSVIAGGGSVVEPSLAGHLMRELAGNGDQGGGGARVSMTGRERDVMRLVCEGLTDREIGERLFVSTRTVQNDLRRLRDKAGLKRRSELVHWATSRSLA